VTQRAAADTGKLDAADWTKAALELLSEQGIDGVRVEPLAKRLAITKGSFYWHFKDRDALLLAMLDDWRRRATLDVIERLERTHEPAEIRLIRLLRLPFLGAKSERGAEVELSIRLWGRHDPRARIILEEVDTLRLRHIAHLLEDIGVAAADAQARAVIAYSFMRVGATLVDRADEALFDRCAAALIRP
jgi:AcrR family transcriptional regulator